MDEQMTKTKILELIHSERNALQATLQGLSEDQIVQPGAQDDWSVKDILAHITDWEKRMVQWIEESLRGEVPQRPTPGKTWDDLDRLNEQTYLSNKNRVLNKVLADSDRSYQRALQMVQALTEKDLTDPERFAWREGDPMWHMVAANTWWHYKEHREAIDNWLKETQVE